MPRQHALPEFSRSTGGLGDLIDWARDSQPGKTLLRDVATIRCRCLHAERKPCTACDKWAAVNLRHIVRWLFRASGARIWRDKFGRYQVAATADQYVQVGEWLDLLAELAGRPVK